MTPQQQNERAFLGAIFNSPDALFDVAGSLPPDAFRFEQNRAIWETMLRLFEQGKAVDLVTVQAALNDEETRQACEAAFIHIGVQAENAAEYAELLRKAHGLRIMGEATSRIQEAMMDGDMAFDELTEFAEGQIMEASSLTESSQGRPISASVQSALKELFEGEKSGIGTGFSDLDYITQGWRAGELTILAARPGVGKSALAMQTAVHAAEQGIPTAFFSLEMSDTELTKRVIVWKAGVDPERARTGQLTESEQSRLTLAAGKIDALPLYIYDRAALTPIELRAICRRLKLSRGLGMIAVDYLQLMTAPNLRRTANREQEIAQISRNLKALAKELSIPVLALAQLNRQVEHRADARPQLSDLRESGALEQDADNVLFIYRPEAHGIKINESGKTEGLAEVIIAKQRNGPTGKAELTFNDGRFLPRAKYQTA